MGESAVIEPMTQDLIVWRCLHSGVLTRESVYTMRPGLVQGRTD